MLQKVGCSGFPVARASYFKSFSAVEIASSFLKPPRPQTARAWREEAPPDFEFSVVAWRLITHPESPVSRERPDRRRGFCGNFKPTAEVSRAWEATEALARDLRARFIVFETPRSFVADANTVRDMYRFFKEISRRGAAMVWRPRGRWDAGMTERVCKDLGLILAADPLAAARTTGSVQYFRPEPDLGETAMRDIAERCREKPTYLFFGGRTAWADARRYRAVGGVR